MTRVVTFYSYKGGVGRTMALVNTAHVLARDGWRVLMIDFDLEAPGITHFFAKNAKTSDKTRDAVDLLIHAKHSLAAVNDGMPLLPATMPSSLEAYTIELTLPAHWQEDASGVPYRNGRLDLIPASLENIARRKGAPDYLDRLADLDLPGIFSTHGPRHGYGAHLKQYFHAARFDAPGHLLFTLRDRIRASYDIVLIDSRTGLNEIAGLCIGPVCDVVVICCALNNQNIRGTQYLMRRTSLLTQDAKPYVVCVGPVPPWQTEQSSRQIDDIKRLLQAKAITLVPYHPRASLVEAIFVIDEPREAISTAYENLAKQIVEAIGLRRAIGDVVRLKSNEASLQDVGTILPIIRIDEPSVEFQYLFTRAPTTLALSGLPRKGRKLTTHDAVLVTYAAAVAAYRLRSDTPLLQAYELYGQMDRWESRPAPWGSPTFDRSDNLAYFLIRLLFWRLRLFQGTPSDELASEAGAMMINILARLQKDIDMSVPVWLAIDCVSTVTYMRERSLGDGLVPSFMDDTLVDRLVAAAAIVGRRPAVLPNGQPGGEGQMLRALSGLVLSPDDRGRLRRLLASDSVPRTDVGEDGWAVRRQQARLFRYPQDELLAEWAPPPLSTPLVPLGFWPEVNMAILHALVGGEDDAAVIVDWLKLARRVYGYAWRVMADWAQLAKVSQASLVRDFMAAEDLEIEPFEGEIDTGVVPI